MHEMSLAEGIRRIAEDVAQRNAAPRVDAIHLAIGCLATVDVESLRFGLDVALRGSVADGARIIVERIPGQAWCWDCAATVEILGELAHCTHCNGTRLQVTGGSEMRVREIELAATEGEGLCA